MIEATKRRYTLYRHYGHNRMTALTMAIPPHFFYAGIAFSTCSAIVIVGSLA